MTTPPNEAAHAAAAAEAAAYPSRWPALFILLLASFMNLIDVTIVNVALPSMQANLGANSSQIEWVVAAYVLSFALFLLPFGRLGDIVGRKRMFLIGVTAFTIGSALCGLAPSIEMLIGARVLQGIAGAMMTPQVLSIVQVIFPAKERGLAFSFFGLTAGLASVAGPIAGGLLISADLWGLDWRPIFLVNIPLGILTVAVALRLVPKITPHPGLTNDFVGIGIFGLAILAVVFPLVEGRVYGWPLWAFGLIALGLAGMVVFYLWEKRRDREGKTELLPVSLLENRNFVVGTLMTLIFFSGIPGLFMILAIFLQSGFGLTPLESGLTTLPFPLGVLIISIIGGRLGSRFLNWRVAIGSLLLAGGMFYLRWTFGQVGDVLDHWAFVPPLFIAGMGLGLGVSALFQTILTGVPGKDAGSASGALQAFQQVGGALGVALVGEIFFTWLEHAREWGATSMHSGFVNAASNAAWYEIGAFVVVAAMVPLIKRLPPQGAPPVHVAIEA
jgi:EmrB/QacA subfamily drug resistance transporter